MAPLDLDAIANSSLGVRVVHGLGRATPPAVGYRLADRVADAVAAKRDSAMVRAVRSNQWVVSGGMLVGEELQELVRETFRHMAHCLYDLYHVLDESERLGTLVELDDKMLEWIERSREGQSLMLVGAHMSNFDLMGRALAASGLRAQVLSVPEPSKAYRAQNEMRRKMGLDVTPISLGALRAAEKRLARGGCVITGVDRPVPGARQEPLFFGRPAKLPTVHVRLAASTGAPLVAVMCRMRSDGIYRVSATGPMELSGENAPAAVKRDAEQVLKIAEDAIKRAPTQWAMPHAVWPRALDEVAG